MHKKILIVEDEFIIADSLSFILKNAGYHVCGIADTVEEAIQLIHKYQPELVLLDIYLKGSLTGIDLAQRLGEMNIAFVYLSANADQEILKEAKKTRPYGFMVKPFREKDVLVGLEMAQYQHEQNALAKKNSELLLHKTLTDVIADATTWSDKLLKIAKTLQSHIPFDYLAIGMKNFDTVPYQGRNFLCLGFDEYQVITPENLASITGIKKQELIKLQEPVEGDEETLIYNDKEFTRLCLRNAEKAFVGRNFKMSSNLSAYIPVAGHKGFTMSFYSRKSVNYTHRHLMLMKRMEKTLSQAINGILHTQSGAMVVQQVSMPPQSREVKCMEKSVFDGIIGSSILLKTALEHLSLVAPMQTTVLILGESGTGKERFARLVHGLSARKNKPLVTVNCAALPTHLIESELFGHEKGAFTGAIDRRIGKFEQATGGTIFLDEVGELPLELQAKLLRVLQEKEIERLGGRETLKVDVRVVAATNCNLEKQVADGRFRLDLYYRLNIFPITLPSLRERKEDLPQLANYFVKKFGERAGKPEMSISEQALHSLNGYHWPGNARELEHLIERSVLLNRGTTIEQITMINRQGGGNPAEDNRIKTIDDNEREHILLILKKCNGRISGPGGAAELLAVPSTTLNSKMKRLGITRQHISAN